MIATVLLAGLFILLGMLGGWISYRTGVRLDDDFDRMSKAQPCAGCGRVAESKAGWMLGPGGRLYCSGDCWAGS